MIDNYFTILCWFLPYINMKQPSVQFSSGTQSCPTLCDPMDCSMPGLPVRHQLPEFIQIHVHWVAMPSNHLILCWPFSSHLQSFPASGAFQISQLYPSGYQSIGVSASASVLPMNIQDWFPLGWTCWIYYIWGEFFPACAQSRNYPSSIFMTMLYLSFLPLICLIHFFL